MKLFLAGLALGVVVLCAGYAIASRNSSGTMAAINGPYVSGTTISSSAVNARLSDIETELTDSLDRSGKGGMLAALRGVDGTAVAPAFSWTSETGTGHYRVGTGDLGLAVSGTKVADWQATGLTITASAGAPANFFTPTLAAGSFSQILVGGSGVNNNSGGLTFRKNATPANSTYCLDVFGQTSTFCVDGNGKTIVGATGTGISGSFRGTAALTPASVPATSCASSTTITVTGAATGSECMVGQPSAGPNGLSTTCYVSASNSAVLQFCNGTSGALTPTAGTYAVRVFNP